MDLSLVGCFRVVALARGVAETLCQVVQLFGRGRASKGWSHGLTRLLGHQLELLDDLGWLLVALLEIRAVYFSGRVEGTLVAKRLLRSRPVHKSLIKLF